MATVLYHGEPNGPSFTVLAALAETGVEAELKHIDLAIGERHSPAVPKNPQVEMSIEGEGPVLVVDGEAMADSVFIACFLDDVGNGTIRPADPYRRWEMMAWCRYVVERLAPAAAYLGGQAHLAARLEAMSDARFDALVSRFPSDDLAERWRAARAGDYAEDRLEGSRTKVKEAVARVEAKLEGDWILGDFTIADLETYAWLAGMIELVPEAFAETPKTKAWLERVRSRPAVQTALGLSRTNDPRKSWAVGPEINRWG